MAETSIQLTLRARDLHGASKNPTAAELAAALTFAHRVLNRVAVGVDELALAGRSSFDLIREEPGAVNFEIQSARDGSVVLAGIVTVASDPFVQGVAGGIIANVITPKLLAAAEKTKGLFRRPAKASSGRTIQLELEVESSTVKVEVQYFENAKTRIKVQVQPSQQSSPKGSSDA